MRCFSDSKSMVFFVNLKWLQGSPSVQVFHSWLFGHSEDNFKPTWQATLPQRTVSLYQWENTEQVQGNHTTMDETHTSWSWYPNEFQDLLHTPTKQTQRFTHRQKKWSDAIIQLQIANRNNPRHFYQPTPFSIKSTVSFPEFAPSKYPT